MNGATGAPLEGAFQWTFVPGLPRPGASNVAKQPGADSSDQNPGSLRGDSVSATPAAAPKGGKRSGPGENGTAEFPMPRDEFGTLTVEAADFQPFVRTAVRLPYGVDRHELPVLLDPIAKATGIELQVTGPDGTPISAVQVRAEQPNVVGRASTWLGNAGTRRPTGSTRCPTYHRGATDSRSKQRPRARRRFASLQ